MAEVIMPALGMAQDTGRLVQWLKQPGEAVTAGDLLFEVETDKSTMEVEAQATGFLTHVSAFDGDDVPVGQTIAMISDTAADSHAALTAAQPNPEVEVEAAPAPAPVAAAHRSPPETSGPSSGRILASPKARRLARQDGLDLGVLARAGHPQPYHVADLQTVREMPTGTPAGPKVVMVTLKQISARADRQSARAFMDWMHSDGAVTVTHTDMFASFAASALREATERGTVIVRVSAPDQDDRTLRNPDFKRLSAPVQQTDEAPDLVLHDLSDSFLITLRLGDPVLPTLSVGVDGDSYIITFEFGADHLSDAAAIAFVTGLARRLADPLHHLV